MANANPTGENADGCFLCAADTDRTTDLLVHTTDLSLAILNRFPYNSGHLLLAPRRHTPDLLSLSPSELSDLMTEVQFSLQVLTGSLHPQGFNIGINHGKVAGGSVSEHLHVHVIPRWEGDTNFLAATSETKVISQSLPETANLLRTAYAKLAAAGR